MYMYIYMYIHIECKPEDCENMKLIVAYLC